MARKNRSEGGSDRFVGVMAEETGLEPASPKAAVFKTAALPIMLLLRSRGVLYGAGAGEFQCGPRLSKGVGCVCYTAGAVVKEMQWNVQLRL